MNEERPRPRPLGEEAQWCELHLGRCDVVHPFSRGSRIASGSAMLVCTSCLHTLKQAQATSIRKHGRFDYWQLTPVLPCGEDVRWSLGTEEEQRHARPPARREWYELSLTPDQAVILRAHGYTLRHLGPLSVDEQQVERAKLDEAVLATLGGK